MNEADDDQTETIYLVRVDALPTKPALLTDEQLRDEHVVGQAWWTTSELLAPTAVFTPRRLPALAADIIAFGPPDTPINVSL